jgi:hypothetical protein
MRLETAIIRHAKGLERLPSGSLVVFRGWSPSLTPWSGTSVRPTEWQNMSYLLSYYLQLFVLYCVLVDAGRWSAAPPACDASETMRRKR